MQGELADIRHFLRGHRPFALLPADVVDSLAEQIEPLDATPETVVLRARQYVDWLYIVRSGKIAIRGINGDIWSQRIEGETFGVQALLGDGQSPFDAVALQDSTILRLPGAMFARLQTAYPAFERFFAPLGGTGGSPAHADARLSAESQANLIALRVRDLMTRDAVMVDAHRPVNEAAALMRDRGVSFLPVTLAGKLAGIISDAHLRDGVAIQGLSSETQVSSVMTGPPQSVGPDTPALDALLAMEEGADDYLPVLEHGQPVGILDKKALLQRQDDGFGYFRASILERRTPASIARVVARIPQLLVSLVETGVAAHRTGLILSSVADITNYRLLQLAEERLGPPPVPYVWVSCGSLARQEQTAVSDQDNCLILDDGYDPTSDGAYFDELSRLVCNGLHACGYDLCPGEMMAMTAKWRQPLARWIDYFATWIEEPAPTAQLLSSVLFDLRPVRGDFGLFDQLQQFTAAKARGNSVFIAHMVSNALTHMPPLGLFRKFVLIRGGEHDHQVDLKLHGTVPIIDLARIYALLAGVKSASTRDRLIEAHAAGVLSKSGMHDLIDAFEFISMVRLKHQSRRIQTGQSPDTFVEPGELSRIERHRLRDAFLAIRSMQSSVASTYPLRR